MKFLIRSVASQELQCLAGFGVFEANTLQLLEIILYPDNPDLYHVESSCPRGQEIQQTDFVGLTIHDMNENRNIATQIQQDMQSNRQPCWCAQWCPWR